MEFFIGECRKSQASRGFYLALWGVGPLYSLNLCMRYRLCEASFSQVGATVYLFLLFMPIHKIIFVSCPAAHKTPNVLIEYAKGERTIFKDTRKPARFTQHPSVHHS